VSLRSALEKIYTIIDEDDPAKHASALRRILKGMRKSLRRGELDDEMVDMVEEYLDNWLADDAIEEDIDSFIEDTNDVYDAFADEEEEEDDEEE